MNAMKMSCLMPTYGRPTLVQNAIACFLAQDYPANRRRLLILDDAGQLPRQDGEGWSVWSTPVRMESLPAKYVRLEQLDEGWADVFVIWDDDDIYLPWHLSAHAAALQGSRWSYPEKIWTLYGGTPRLALSDGTFWSSAAVRTDLLKVVGGFVQTSRADFDQTNLSTWRERGGEPGRPEPPSFVYGWGRSKHASVHMSDPASREWYSRVEITEGGRVARVTPRMDAQTQAVLAALAPSADKKALSAPAAAADDLGQPYDVVRALLRALETDDVRSAIRETRRILLSSSFDPRPELWTSVPGEAEYHGVAPLLAPMISAGASGICEGVPDEMRRTFVALASRHRRAAAVREKCVDQLLTAFAAADIPVILLKGAALAHLIYPAPELRPMVDIDVLIHPADSDRAARTVRGLGYAFAARHESRFAGHIHHLPVASTTVSGFRIPLEIHLDAISPNFREKLSVATLSAEPRPFQRGTGPPGLALGHTDMLRHLARHTFEPVNRVRLKHLYDLRRYRAAFANEIDWKDIEQRFSYIMVALKLADLALADPRSEECDGIALQKVPTGIGMGMLPLSEIAKMPFAAQPAALFNPSAWWLHGFYGVPTDRSLLLCRTARHPLTLVRWFAKRLAAAIVQRSPFPPR